MAIDLFAGLPVTDFDTALAWYRKLFGADPSFYPHDIEAVWELGRHCYVYIEQVPDRAGGSMHMVMVDDIRAVAAAISERGLEPARVETFEGMRRVIFRDPDGNEVSYGGMAAEDPN
ncbi:MAG TPA: VOC family protein [Microbacterium sp.]|uniref:VOC family protein n=1 Tax=Microbacterium sp. TaxID=51671 RepID=UPI002C77C2D5|nr:VOC family protein [Microbacterium sp.]HWI30139.1 VOC family protein [Microbacterium sp.]